MNDGFVASTAYAGARSCPYCAHFEEDGHATTCSFYQLERRALNAEAALSAVMNDWALKKTISASTLAHVSHVLVELVPF
jgi:hypothetical protein